MGDLSLIETYDKLKTLQKQIEKLEDLHRSKSGTLQVLERRKERLDGDMKIYEQIAVREFHVKIPLNKKKKKEKMKENGIP